MPIRGNSHSSGQAAWCSFRQPRRSEDDPRAPHQSPQQVRQRSCVTMSAGRTEARPTQFTKRCVLYASYRYNALLQNSLVEPVAVALRAGAVCALRAGCQLRLKRWRSRFRDPVEKLSSPKLRIEGASWTRWERADPLSLQRSHRGLLCLPLRSWGVQYSHPSTGQRLTREQYSDLIGFDMTPSKEQIKQILIRTSFRMRGTCTFLQILSLPPAKYWMANH